jgi:hypothetical protein
LSWRTQKEIYVFARRFFSIKRFGLGLYSIVTGIATPALIVTGMSNPIRASISFALVGIVAFGWVAIIAAKLTRDLSGE